MSKPLCNQLHHGVSPIIGCDYTGTIIIVGTTAQLSFAYSHS